MKRKTKTTAKQRAAKRAAEQRRIAALQAIPKPYAISLVAIVKRGIDDGDDVPEGYGTKVVMGEGEHLALMGTGMCSTYRRWLFGTTLPRCGLYRFSGALVCERVEAVAATINIGGGA